MGKNTKYGNVKRGPAIDLADGNNYMSGWERDVARFLTYLTDKGIVEGWEYEPQRFSFIGWYNSNPLFYLPDFVLKFSSNNTKAHKLLKEILPDAAPEKVLYLEVKGQETGRDRNKWKRFRKCTGNTLNVLKRDEMKLIQELYSGKIENWESRIV